MPYFFYFEKVVELTEIINKVYEKIKIISDVRLNELKTKFIIESVIQDSINYMNREDFPEELINPTAIYIYKYNFDKNRNIKSMKSAERQVEFVTGLNGDAEFRKSLNRFRKLGVVK
jgi:hypothetical protein|nr:MAG TPA: tail connector protein [Caudoviricetes sp.]